MTTFYRPEPRELRAINRKPFAVDYRIGWWLFGVVCGAAAVIAVSWAVMS